MEKPIKYIRKELRYNDYNSFTKNINNELNKIIEDGWIIHTYNEIFSSFNDGSNVIKVVLLLVKYNDKQIL